jgi:2'-5' RNA ligase
MEQSILQLPGYKACEFLVVLQPHEELWNRITDIKKEFADAYDCPMAAFTKPHITLINFVQYAMMEQRIINRLKLIAMGLPPIKVEMKGFGSFPSHTIYINITSKVPIVNMVKQLRQAQALLKINNENKPHFITEPHLPVARKLLPWQYEKGWLEYEQKHFSGRFIADQILLLKRRVGEKPYQVAGRFKLENLPVVTTQGMLFAPSPPAPSPRSKEGMHESM